MSCCVYKIQNKVNAKLYIGSTINGIQTRWEEHKKEHRQNVRHQGDVRKPLYIAMRDYGVDQFWIEPIEECQNELIMHRREVEIIKDWATIHPNGYNLRNKIIDDEEAAIIRFNVYGWSARQYADAFGVSIGTIRYVNSCYSPFKHVTRDHIPDNVDAIMERAAKLRDIRKQGAILEIQEKEQAIKIQSIQKCDRSIKELERQKQDIDKKIKEFVEIRVRLMESS